MHDPFDRRVSCGATALVLGRLRNKTGMWERIFDDKLDGLIRHSSLFENMPFLWINISYRYGIKNDLKIYYGRINKKYGELPVALELDMEILEWADRHNLDLLHDIFMIAALEALIQVGKKYKFPTTVFEEERSKYSQIPSTIEECQNYSRLSA